MSFIDTSGFDRADILIALYGASRPIGLGMMRHVPGPMTRDEAATLLSQTTSFDYLRGRVMKIDLSDENGFESWLYDRDNGEGAAQRAVDSVLAAEPVMHKQPQQQAQGCAAGPLTHDLVDRCAICDRADELVDCCVCTELVCADCRHDHDEAAECVDCRSEAAAYWLSYFGGGDRETLLAMRPAGVSGAVA